MSKSQKRARQRTAPAESAASGGGDGSSRPTALCFRPVATYVLGVAYIMTAMTLLVLSQREDGRIGAVCGAGCGGTTLLEVSLEWWGSGLMAAVLLSRWIAARTQAPFAGRLVMVLALGHAGASLAFAGSQWIGLVDVCPLCQVAALFSFAVALSCLPVLRAGYEAPLVPSLQSLALGFMAVASLWPFLDGIDTASPPQFVAEQTTVPATSQTSPLIDQAMEALTFGDPDAPYELVVITDFTCRVCERFETQHLPAIVQEGVETGRIRVRFLLPHPIAMGGGPYHELVAVTSLAMAGLSPPETFKLMRAGRLSSTPQGINRATDPQLRQQALEIVGKISAGNEWGSIAALHDEWARTIRQRYFRGRTGTPAFVMVRGRFNPGDLPSPDDPDMLALYGMQLASSFLEFATPR